jgi:hypothetical protein
MMETQAVVESAAKSEGLPREMPRSDAMSAELAEYVTHFCGVDCYEAWMESRRTEELKVSGD